MEARPHFRADRGGSERSNSEEPTPEWSRERICVAVRQIRRR